MEDLFEQRCDALARQANRHALAVDGPLGSLTYLELDARANQLARYLSAETGVRAGDRVGLLFDYPGDAYVAMLAILKLHAAYVPLDAAFPPERLAYMVADAGVRTVLSSSQLAQAFSDLDAGTQIVFLDEVDERVAGQRSERLGGDELTEPVDDLCYVIYTSGTTGRPKGVAVGHASICNFVRVASEVYGVEPGDRVYQGLTLAFDFSVEEIWVAWMSGATLVPKATATALLGAELREFLLVHRVTALCCVPTLLATLDEDLPDLRFLLVSGEACPQELVERWHRPDRRFLNVYGPTEATVSATWTLLHPSRRVTIGVPLPTYSLVVLDPEADRVLEPGAIGELGIGGIGLAQGYLNRPDLTERAFIPDFVPLPDNPSGRIYRTGDLVRINADGELEHHGRIDTQVKIRGYRIELAEIEAALRQIPGIRQAAVRSCEVSPAVKELVGYYTARDQVDPAAMHAQLREKLPAYMVPSFLERLPDMPMLPSGKIDRARLPAPGSRHRLRTATPVAPASELEATLAGELAAVLGLEEVSVESHFFNDLAANSLLMAQFTARLRQARGGRPAVSMKDVYLHPTVRSLGTVLADREGSEDRTGGWDEPELPEARGKPRHGLCGALQLLAFLFSLALGAFVLDAAAGWMFSAHGILSAYLRALEAGTGLLLLTAGLPIAAKWLLIGRWTPRRIPIWSLAYLRFWVVKTLLLMNPVPHLLVGTPLYPLYLRALGARIGSRALILSRHIPVCTDLISVGADAVIQNHAYLNGYRARAGMIEIGPVRIEPGSFVGEHAVLDIATAVGSEAQLGHASSLHAGQRVPAGECWYGSPAEPAPSGYDYRAVGTLAPSRGRALRYALGRLLVPLLILGPLEAGLGGVLLTHPRWMERLSPAELPLLAGVPLLALVIGSLTVALGSAWLLTPLLKTDRDYPVYGFHYGVLRVVSLLSNNPLLTGLFGDSCAIVHYLRLLGYRFGRIEQTGSNFGLNVRHEVPRLCHVGTGTMVSDGLSMVNAQFSSTAFRVRPVKIGERNYLGNTITFPAGARTGENCLFATKALVPLAGPPRADVGILGSPPFEIPRAVARDRRFEAISTGAERARRLRAKTRHNLVTMVLHLFVFYLMFLGLMALAASPFGGAGLGHLAGTAVSELLELTFVLGLFVLAERAVTGFRPLQPKYCSIYEPPFWRHERFWKVAPTGYFRLLDGTPFKPILWRLVGVRVGRRVFDDGLAITERTLVRIGAESTFNMGANLQSHTLEDGVFKSDHIVIGRGCTLGTAALVNYGVTMGDGSSLAPDSFLMKGSRVEPNTRWAGNPAREIDESRGGRRGRPSLEPARVSAP